ncbi:MAG: carboxypeptidase-like regulatory domain-containing protein [Desulfobacterales bacterium]|nr:carboxypeptidase-like regulatory domain-containing protein [Desulfobacterales bacterium]
MVFLSKCHKTFMVMLILFLGIFRSVAFSGDLIRYDPAISGKIVDYDTRRPMKGVVVSAVWFHEQFRLSEASKREYYDYFETLTDQDGNFRIPGKGLRIIRNIYPPTISIFKAGYSILHLQNLALHSRQDLPSRDEVKWVDGKAIIFFHKKSSEERKRYLQAHTAVPLFQMMRDGFPSEKTRLYVRELKKEYEGVEMMNDQFHLRYKKGIIFPAKENSLKRKSSE